MSKKHNAKLREYRRVKAELEKELKDNGEWKCFFSDTPIPDYYTWKDVSWHHLKGRDGDLIVDKRYIRPVADKYHTGDEGFHNHPKSWLESRWWWQIYINNLSNITVR